MSSTEPGSGLSPAASQGFRDAAAYDAHRPAYPPAAIDKLLDRMGLLARQRQQQQEVVVEEDVQMAADATAGVKIVEVAAGTGKFTEALVEAVVRRGGGGSGGCGEVSGGMMEILATEPHPDMLRELQGKALPGVVVRKGAAEELARVVCCGEEGWADGVIAAQAFHWFATDQVLGEIHRVLKPGGVFGMIWNIDDYNKPKAWKASTQWAQHLNDWILSLSGNDNNKRFRDMAWQDVFTNQVKTNPLQALQATVTQRDMPKFSVPLGEDSVEWTHWLSEEGLWKRINTLSHVALLHGDEKARGERVFREAMAMADVQRNEVGEVECYGRTYFAWTDRL